METKLAKYTVLFPIRLETYCTVNWRKAAMASFKVAIQQSPEGQKHQKVPFFVQSVPVGS
jgi:hypothetical protein